MNLRAVLFAPTPSSLYSRLLSELTYREEGLELAGIAVRSMWSWRRIRGELRRDGPRLIRKVYNKLWLGTQAYPSSEQDTLAHLAAQVALPDENLKQMARRFGIPFLQRDDLNEQAVVRFLAELQPDVIIFTGGGLVRAPILEIPNQGVLNCHSGILPRYRGMDVVEWAILEAEGEPDIGLTLHFMDRGVDTGPILMHHREQLREADRLDAIRRRLEPQMVRLMLNGLRGLRDETLHAKPQAKGDGRQYFVMHPRLKAAAARKVVRLAGQL